ncbi:MAG: hypothetical protein H7246_02470 [Phycisphaerae bacterium]|nr:hypothetical protein [Saprospiraceae bacterium]
MSTKLQLRIHRVKCVDETNGQWVEKFGNDEIFLGGFAVDEKAQTTEIKPFSVYPHFDDGDVKNYSPPRVFHTFPLSGAGEWPRTFGIGLVLIEKDAGGMAEAVNKITSFAKGKILEELAKEKKKNTDKKNQVQGFLGLSLGALLLLAIKAAAPYILDYVIKKIMAAFDDEIFKPEIATIDLPSANHNWSGALDTVEKIARFKDHGGIYEVTYDWALS